MPVQCRGRIHRKPQRRRPSTVASSLSSVQPRRCMPARSSHSRSPGKASFTRSRQLRIPRCAQPANTASPFSVRITRSCSSSMQSGTRLPSFLIKKAFGSGSCGTAARIPPTVQISGKISSRSPVKRRSPFSRSRDRSNQYDKRRDSSKKH